MQEMTHSADASMERPTEVSADSSMHESHEMVTAQASIDQEAELAPLYEEREGQRQFSQGPSFEAT